MELFDECNNCTKFQFYTEKVGRDIPFFCDFTSTLKTQYFPLRIARLRSLAAIFLMLKNRKISVAR